jgi:hypothetical protein
VSDLLICVCRVGDVETGAFGSAEVGLEHGHGFVGFKFGSLVLEATEASFLEDRVTGSDGADDREVVSGFGEHHSIYN